MEIKILCIGDVIGSPGKRTLENGIASLKKEHQIHCVIVNAENIAGGSGITPDLYQKVVRYGANLVTLGDHIYRKNAIIPVLETCENMVRPINLPTGAPGKEFAIYESESGAVVAVISVLGRLFMKLPVDCPFRAVDRVLAKLPQQVNIVVVDMHAEATSEKIAMGWHLDGKASIVYGTHTHVQTADETVLPKGTAFISDVGMTGPHDSILGRKKDRVLKTMISAVPSKYDVASENNKLNGIISVVDSRTGKAISIERVSLPVEVKESF